jgi:hypothetical protein
MTIVVSANVFYYKISIVIGKMLGHVTKRFVLCSSMYTGYLL